MLQVLYADHQTPEDDLSMQEVLLQMRDILHSSGYSQVPQLSSSRCLDIQTPFRIVPEDFSGTRRAVVIAINYVGQQGELGGCQNGASVKTEMILLRPLGYLITLPFSCTIHCSHVPQTLTTW